MDCGACRLSAHRHSPRHLPGTAAITAALGVICLAAGFSGYLIGLASAWQRVLLLAAALVLIKPGVVTDAIGIALFGIVFATQWLAAKAARIRSI